MVVVLSLHNGDGLIGAQVQYIIRFLRLFTDYQVSLQVDLAVRDLGFHGDQVFIPFCGNGRRDVMELDVLFRHLLFRQDRAQLHHFLSACAVISSCLLLQFINCTIKRVSGKV